VPRTVKDANLSTITARARLKRKLEPHWRTLIVGRAHLGWQRPPDVREAGKWILRKYQDGRYSVRNLGWADDLAEATGEQILSCEQAEAMARAMLDAPAALPGRLTVRRAMQDYIEHQRDLGKPVADLISRVTAHVLPTLGNVLVQELTTERLRRWRAALVAMPAMVRTAQGARQQYKTEPATDEDIRRRRSSANRVWTMLRAGLNLAFKDGKVASDLTWRRVTPFKSVDAARVRYLSEREATRLINASDREFKALLRAALETGARYGELIRLEVADFNPDSKTIHVRRSKSGEARHVVLTHEGAEFFAQHCAGRAGSASMFQRSNGQPWKASQQGRPMAEACARARIQPAITFHALRHSWASLSVMGGVPLLVVAKNLGHSDTRMVERHYGHLAPNYVADAIRAGAPKFGRVERKVLPLA
jgi:integrase